MRKIAMIFAAFMLILSAGGCGAQVEGRVAELTNTPELTADSPEPSAPPGTPAPEPMSTPILESAAVSMEDYSGVFAIQGDTIYYINGFDNGSLNSMNADGSNSHKLNSGYVSWFTLSGDQIYYSDGFSFFAMNSDGSGQHKLKDDESGPVLIAGGKIYYNNFYDGFALYCMNTDGSDQKKVTDDMALYMIAIGDQIYYGGASRGIYCMKTDGTDKSQLVSDAPYNMILADGWIFYNNQDDSYSLYAVKTDGSDRHKLTDEYALSMNIAGDRIIYSDGNDHKIYSIKTDGNDKRQLSNDNAEWLVVSNGRIYYSITGAKIYSMSMDGSDKQVLVDLDSDAYKNVTYKIDASIHTGMPEYRFVATGVTVDSDNWMVGYVMGLTVYDENGLLLISKDFSEVDNDQVTGNAVFTEMMDTMGLHVTDVNFDGYKDVIILNSFSGAHGNTSYDCWLWDPETSQFVESTSFTGICNPSLDPMKQCIYSSSEGGAGIQSWSICKFINGVFVSTNDLECETTDDANWSFSEQKLVGDQMEIVRCVTVQADDYNAALAAAGYINDDLWQINNPRWYTAGGHEYDQWLEE